MKGKAGSDDNWSKDREQKHSGSEGDGGALPTASLRKLVRKTRWSRQSPHDMFLAVTRTRVPMMCEGCDNEAAHSITFESR